MPSDRVLVAPRQQNAGAAYWVGRLIGRVLPPMRRAWAFMIALALLAFLGITSFTLPSWFATGIGPANVLLFAARVGLMVLAGRCFLAVGRAYGGGLWLGIRLSAYYAAMWAAVIVGVVGVCAIAHEDGYWTTADQHAQELITVAGLALLWWLARWQVLRAAQFGNME